MATDRTFEEIRDSEAAFSMDLGEAETLQGIDAAAGYDSGDAHRKIAEDDVNGGMSLDRALDVVKFRQSSVWSEIDEMAKSLAASHDGKKDLLNLPGHERTAHSDRAAGIRELLARVGSMFQEAGARIASANSEEKLRLGSGVQFAGIRNTELPAPRRTAAPIDPAVASNTKDAIAQFESGKK